MSLPELCIRRPIFAIMINLLIVLFGVVGLLRLPVRELPDVDPPIVTITTVYRGASAEVMEAEVTERIEQEVNTIPGIRTLSSISREAVSIITVRFNLDRDVGEEKNLAGQHPDIAKRLEKLHDDWFKQATP